MKHKHLITAVSCVLLFTTWVALVGAISDVQSDEVYARAFGTNGTKSFAALTNALTQLGSNVARTLVIDGGTWTITNDLDWPSNIAMKVAHDSAISMATTKVLNLDGVNIQALNRPIFPGTGIATGPIGNAYVDTRWQGDRSFYLGPLQTGFVQTVTYTNDLAGLSNGITMFLTNFTTNVTDGLSNALTRYTREQIAASNSLLTSVVAETYLASNATINVQNISYTGFPFWGVQLALASTNGYTNDATYEGGWEHMSNWNIVRDGLDVWEGNGLTGPHLLRPTRVGQYLVTVNGTFNQWNATNLWALVELGWFKNPTHQKLLSSDDVSTNTANAIFMGQASGPGKLVTRLSPAGTAAFNVDPGDTGDTWGIYYRIGDHNAAVNFGTLNILYLGNTNLVK